MVMLQRPTVLPSLEPHLRFQKTGPPSSRKRLGLPPASMIMAPAGDRDSPDAGIIPDPGASQPPQHPALSSPRPSSEPPPTTTAEIQVPIEESKSKTPFTSLLDSLGSVALSSVNSGHGARAGRGAGFGGGLPGRQSGDASFTFDSGGFDLSEWAELVKLKVRSNWIIPTAAYMGMKGIVSIHLIIEKNGVVSWSEIVRQSTVESMDVAAMNAIRSSSPLPALPLGFPKANLDAHFTFYYNLYPRE